NTGNATAKDVKALIELAEERAKQEHGIELIREVKYIG
ncbi:MAG: UDP-N-acetylenolpyruvoylglucosamine reductase, C-terminal domain, partial [Paenibacillus sp.]|nr:UDP-N-acetylenolpyruvoylglucosamine reductase, C-terminal domain [Paenibacillus sp.]